MTEIIRVVVFDMDGVLCDYRFDIRLAELSHLTGRSPADIEAVIWTSGFDEAGDRGSYTAAGYLAEFNRRLDTTVTAAQWLDARRRSIVPRQGALELARSVSARVRVALLTNNGPLFKQGMAVAFPELPALFGPHAHCAYEFGGAKPEARVFRNLALSLGVACHELLFIDDTLEYIEGARSVGVHAHHFTSVDALEDELNRRGLL